MKDLRQILVYLCLVSVLALLIPLFLLNKPHPFEYAAVLKQTLQSSTLLEKAHILSLGSVIPLSADLLWDLASQTAEIAAVAQIKERMTILLTLAAFSLTFLCCKDLASIPAVYVGVNSLRANIVLTVMYYAVYPELNSKVDKTVVRGLFYAMACWLVTNILIAYTVYYDSSTMGVLSTVFQTVLMFFVLLLFSRLMRIIAVQQNAFFVQLDQLTADEYATLSYVIPLIISPLAQLLYSFSSGEVSWQNRSATGLLVHMAIIYILHMALILVPGRILHMFAVTKANLLRLKQIFVRYVSHEIRSPLNVVHVGLEMLVALIKSADPTSPFVPIDRGTADFIIQMFFSSESAINILNDLLQYEHIEAGTFRLSCEALSLVNVMENKFGWANVMASQKGVAFTVTDTSLATEFGPVAAAGPVVAADEESGLDMASLPDEESSLSAQRSLVLYMDIYRIEQVIRNLITNAMKFTPRDGQVSVGISCVLLSSGSPTAIRDKFGPDAVGFFRVEVTDSGVGLTEDERKNIFGEFTQFNKNELQNGGGSGLGLWISRKIIQMHKGVMGVTSAGRGHGSTFFFELPVFGPDYNSPPTQPQSQSLPQPHPALVDERSDDQSHAYIVMPDADFGLTGSATDLQRDDCGDVEEKCDTPHPLRLLIVDDSALNVKVVVRLIESEKAGPFADATLLTADDGTTAVEQLRTEMAAGRAVHFILMDFVMTSMHGPEAARIMREELNYRGAIIGITGNALPEDIDLFVSSGANQVVTKPLSRAKLMDALHHFLPTAMAAAEEEK